MRVSIGLQSTTSGVLILVVMEDSLWLYYLSMLWNMERFVLILVVMEDSLWQEEEFDNNPWIPVS